MADPIWTEQDIAESAFSDDMETQNELSAVIEAPDTDLEAMRTAARSALLGWVDRTEAING